MSQFLAAIPLLACPVGMGAMMWWMSRHQANGANRATQSSDGAGEVTRLRAELDQLRAAHADRTRAAEQNSGSSA